MNNQIVGTSYFTILVTLGVVAQVLPTHMAKVTTACFFIIAFLLLAKSNLAKNFILKVFITAFLAPGVFLALATNPEEVIRYMPLLAIVMLFPMKSFDLDYTKIAIAFGAVILYLVISGFLLALNYDLLIQLRSEYYPIELNAWNYGSIENLDFGQVFNRDFFRVGGIFYNPNYFGITLVLNVACYNFCTSLFKNTHFSMVIYLTGMIGIFSSGSRTAIVGIFLFFLIQYSQKNLVY